jgi:hypothetical protein
MSINKIILIALWWKICRTGSLKNVATRNAYKIFVGKPEGMRPLGRPRRKWEDNIGMYLKKIREKSVDWMYLARDKGLWLALVDPVMSFRVP